MGGTSNVCQALWAKKIALKVLRRAPYSRFVCVCAHFAIVNDLPYYGFHLLMPAKESSPAINYEKICINLLPYNK